MNTGIIKYPLDLTGTAESNAVGDERVTLPRTRSRAFSPRNGPFFANDSFVIRSLPTNTVLTPGTDYTFKFMYSLATAKAGQPICGIVHVTNPAYDGEFSYDYQLIGGEFSSNVEAIQQAIEALELDGRAVHWDDVLDKPVLFPAAPHMHHVNDMYGMEHVIEALKEIAQINSEGDVLLKEEILKRLARTEEDLATAQLTLSQQQQALAVLSDRVTALEM